MAGNQRVYKARIKSTQSLKKIFRAMELIAASRIGMTLLELGTVPCSWASSLPTRASTDLCNVTLPCHTRVLGLIILRYVFFVFYPFLLF